MINRYKNDDDRYYLKGYKIEIFPDEIQREYIERSFVVARYVYNWALGKENEQYKLYKDGLVDKKDKFLSAYTLHRMYTKFRKDKPFLEAFPYEAARIIINDVIYAFESFWSFKNRYPRYKTKKYSENSFPVRSDRVYFEDNMLRIEGLKRRTGKIFTNYHTHECKSDNIKYYNTRITKDKLGHYWFSFKKKELKPLTYFSDNNIRVSEPIGIDLNANPTIVLSNGIIYDRPNCDKINKRIKRCKRKISKDFKHLKKLQEESEKTNSIFEILPSKNAIKRLNKYRKACKKKADMIENFIETSTTKIVKSRPAKIVIEDLSVREMEKNHNIASRVRDSNIYSIIEALKQKSEIYGIDIIVANKYYPSSQLCSCCGFRKKIGSQSIYIFVHNVEILWIGI